MLAHRLKRRHVTSSLWGKHFERPGGVQILFRNLKDFLSHWRAHDGLRSEEAHAFAHLGVGIGAGWRSRHRRRCGWRNRLRFRLRSAWPFAALNESPQGFIGHFHFALLQQNVLDAAIASALPPPAENDRAEGFELGARFVGRQVFEKLEKFFAGAGAVHGLGVREI